jgi:hypothetical protein
MTRTPIYHSILVKEATWARAYLNDLPIYRAGIGPNSRSGPINDLLVQGENELTIELLHAPTPFHSPTLKGAVTFMVYESLNPDAPEGVPVKKRMIHEVVFPELWESAPAERRRFPFYHRSFFDPGVEIHPPPYLKAPSVSFGCDGTPELRAAVERLHASIADNDVDRFLNEIALKLDHYEQALEGEPNARASYKKDQFRNELFHYRLRPEPLDLRALHFEPRAGGRVAHVTRSDGGYVLAAVAQDDPRRRLQTDLLFTQYAGDWRIFA